MKHLIVIFSVVKLISVAESNPVPYGQQSGGSTFDITQDDLKGLQPDVAGYPYPYQGLDGYPIIGLPQSIWQNAMSNYLQGGNYLPLSTYQNQISNILPTLQEFLNKGGLQNMLVGQPVVLDGQPIGMQYGNPYQQQNLNDAIDQLLNYGNGGNQGLQGRPVDEPLPKGYKDIEEPIARTVYPGMRTYAIPPSRRLGGGGSEPRFQPPAGPYVDGTPVHDETRSPDDIEPLLQKYYYPTTGTLIDGQPENQPGGRGSQSPSSGYAPSSGRYSNGRPSSYSTYNSPYASVPLNNRRNQYNYNYGSPYQGSSYGRSYGRSPYQGSAYGRSTYGSSP